MTSSSVQDALRLGSQVLKVLEPFAFSECDLLLGLALGTVLRDTVCDDLPSNLAERPVGIGIDARTRLDFHPVHVLVGENDVGVLFGFARCLEANGQVPVCETEGGSTAKERRI